MAKISRTTKPKTLFILAALSLVLLIVGGIGGWLLYREDQQRRQSFIARITPPPSLNELATRYPKYAEILNDPELDSAYKDFLMAYEDGGSEKALQLARQRGMLTSKDELRLVVELKSDDTSAVEKELAAKGFRVAGVSGNLIDVLIPLPVLEEALKAEDPGAMFSDMTSLDQVKRVRIPRPSTINDALYEGDGSSVIGAAEWHKQGITGKGIKVGILDLGFRDYKKYLGDSLPDDITGQSFVVDTPLDQTQTIHGTACAEVIHSIAPDAQLYLAAYETEVGMRNAVQWLVDHGVQVISNSTGSAYGPLDGSGPFAEVVNDTASKNILWVNSAGNYGESHYRGVFTDEDGNGLHEFEPGKEYMGVMGEGPTFLNLNWDDWGRGEEDYDLYLYNEDLSEIVASSTDIQDGEGSDSAEGIAFDFPKNTIYYVVIAGKHVTKEGLLDFYIANANIEYVEPAYSVGTPGDAESALTVGAVFWKDSNLEPYSSQGPTHDERTKPDISAPARTSSAVYEGPFAGTSASAPHVAGAAALVFQAYPDDSAEQAREYLIDQAVDLGKPGLDNQYGQGALWLGTPPGEEVAVVPTPTAIPEKRLPTATLVTVRKEIPGKTAGTGTLGTVGLICAFGMGAAGLFGFGLALIMLFLNRPSRKPATAYPQPPGRNPQRPPDPRFAPPPPPVQPAPQQPPPYPPAQPALNPLDQKTRREAWTPPQPQQGNQPPAFPKPPAVPQPPAAPQPPHLPAGPLVPCPVCGKPRRQQAKFCPHCGAALSAMPAECTCRHCGKPVRSGSRFCPSCGKPNP